jgi:Mg/Co/Ni transporter MgtE
MKWKFWLGRVFARSLSPQELSELVKHILPHVWEQMPRDQKVNFLKSAAHEHLGTLLEGLNREERTALMNDMLPLAAREFPLSDLDFLTVFSSPGDRYNPNC